MGTTQTTSAPPSGELNLHDWKVVGFHVLIAFLLGGVQALLHLNFGPYTVMVYLFLQSVAELLRRLLV